MKQLRSPTKPRSARYAYIRTEAKRKLWKKLNGGERRLAGEADAANFLENSGRISFLFALKSRRVPEFYVRAPLGSDQTDVRSLSFVWVLLGALAAQPAARANVALFLEEPFGDFGGMNPTGHASVYLSEICAASPVSLRRCRPGEQGVVLSRYYRVDGYDWLAMPLIPYLYSVERADQVPECVNATEVARLRDAYRRKHLEAFAPDRSDGTMPKGDWVQLVGAAYDRTIYSFELPTTRAQDDRFIHAFNHRRNKSHFNLVFHNCADFARNVIDFYYPRLVHRSLIADVGMMTPKQAAKCVVHFGRKHQDELSIFAIPQVPGQVPRSKPVRGVLESLLKSKKYMVPLAPLAVLHPYFGGGLVFAWIEGGHFNPRRIATAEDSVAEPLTVAQDLKVEGPNARRPDTNHVNR